MISVASTALAWANLDPNPTTKRYIIDNLDILNIHFDNSRIQFGTAGLRAPMHVGPKNMNDLVIVQTTQGLASYLHSLYPNPATPLHVIIGYDHRCNPTLNLSSLKFAKIASAVFAKSNISSTVFSTLVATPLVPFAVQETSSALGIMVTASHNPKEDDGFKVYWGNGCQIIPPHDSNITEHILKNLTPWKLFDEEALSEVVVNSGETTRLVDLYFKAISNSLVKTSTKSPKAPQNPHHPPPKFAYTAMHGVGHPFTKRSFEIFNLPEFIIVESQIEPDFTFPTGERAKRGGG